MATTRKKIVVYVEEEFKTEWERLAAKRFRPASVEAERLMSLELEQAYETGELENANDEETPETAKISYEQAVEIVEANSDNGQTRTLAILKTAQLLGLEGEKLLEACIEAGLKPKNGNGATKKQEVSA